MDLIFAMVVVVVIVGIVVLVEISKNDPSDNDWYDR